MEVRLIIDDKFINVLKSRLKTKNTSEVIREGLGLLDWASEQVAQGKVILSVRENGEDPQRIETPALRAARPSDLVSA